jgi:hypothetical protein
MEAACSVPFSDRTAIVKVEKIMKYFLLVLPTLLQAHTIHSARYQQNGSGDWKHP